MSTSKDPNLPDVHPNITPEMIQFLTQMMTKSQGTQNPQGPTPPQPPQPGQNADVTGARPLHSETTPARQLDIQPNVKPNIFTPRPLTTSAPKTGEDSLSDDMLQSVSSHSMTSLVHHEVCCYTPSAHSMYYVLSQMDKTMSTTKRWLDNSFGWIPSYSRLYYGVLFIIQTLRAQRDAGTLKFDTLQLLQTFETYFAPGNLLIAGPLVPIFKGLATSKIDSDLFGNVAPRLPESVQLSTNGVQVPTPVDDNIKYHLPAIPAIFDEICTAQHLGPGNQDVNQQILINGSAAGAFGTAFTAQSPATDYVNWPGMYPAIPLTTSVVDSFFTCSPSYSFPIPMTNAQLTAGVTNWFEYCRLSTGTTHHHEWMSRLSGTMNNYAQFFRGSIPLGDISSSSLPTGQIIGKYRENTLPTEPKTILTRAVSNTATGHYYNRPDVTSLSTDWTSATMAIPPTEEWRAFFAQLNCLHNRFADNPPPLHRTGVFWTLPTVRTLTNADPCNSVALIIARKFHRSNRDETI